MSTASTLPYLRRQIAAGPMWIGGLLFLLALWLLMVSGQLNLLCGGEQGIATSLVQELLQRIEATLVLPALGDALLGFRVNPRLGDGRLRQSSRFDLFRF